jgi:hypothetical protein
MLELEPMAAGDVEDRNCNEVLGYVKAESSSLNKFINRACGDCLAIACACSRAKKLGW